jgi:hypothetical protein
MMGPKPKPLAERFWSKVDKGGPNGCWVWTGAPKPNGYGYLWSKGRNIFAHRLSWIINKGPLPDGLLVCHRCDNRICVNPDHLFLGTHRDNLVDAISKGRVPEHPIRYSRLTAQQVAAIKAAKTPEEATAFGVSLSYAQNIRAGIRTPNIAPENQ